MIHRVPYRYFSGGSVLMLPIVVLLLIYTLAQGKTIGGANASRWIQIPFVGVSFQSSTLASVVVMIYVSRYLAKHKQKVINFRDSLIQLWAPVGIILMLILPANFSTTAIIFVMVLFLTFLGGYPLKYLMNIIGMGIIALTFFVLIAKAFPNAMPNRVDTWMNRIDQFVSNEEKEEPYQVEKAKSAIVIGGITGLGPGKSKLKHFLPQVSSDFIYPLIIEEYGLIGGMMVIGAYFFLMFRILMAARKASSVFATLLVIGVGFPIIFQAMINMAVATNLFPVTGQTLPLLSSGGTSIWMTCIAIGIILSVTAAKDEEHDADPSLEHANPLDLLHEKKN